MFIPKLFTCLKDYNKDMFFKDFVAGLVVAIIALPLSIALAIASGVSPEKGLITAIIGGFIVSLLGGSRVQIGGPTGAFVVIVLGIMSKYGLEGLIIATFMAGIIMILMGLFKMGNMIKYIPYPITTGFTSGIAVIIFSSQIKDFFGLTIDYVPGDFFAKWHVYLSHMRHINLTALGVGLATVGIIVYWPKVNKKVPGAFVAILVTTLVAFIFKLDLPTIESQFGQISSSIPAPSIPDLSLNMVRELFMSAVAIALLGCIESLLSAVVADGMIGGNHRSNMELVGQGVANIGSALFGGIPVTGAIARTAANVKNGGRTPVAGMVHAVTLFFMMLILMPYVKYIPMASLAGILIVVAYNMGEWDEFKSLKSAPKSDCLVFLTTFSLTIVFDLIVAIEIGMVLAAFLFMKRMADVTKCDYISGRDRGLHDSFGHFMGKKTSSEIDVYEVTGPFFFGAADKFIKVIKSVQQAPKVLILKLTHVPVIDATGYAALLRFQEICDKHKIQLLVVGLQDDPLETLEKYGFIDLVGREHVYPNLNQALIRAKSLV